MSRSDSLFRQNAEFIMTLHVTGKNFEFQKYKIYPNLVRAKSRERVLYKSANE